MQAVWSFKLSHYKRESSVSDIKKKQVKKEWNLVYLFLLIIIESKLSITTTCGVVATVGSNSLYFLSCWSIVFKLFVGNQIVELICYWTKRCVVIYCYYFFNDLLYGKKIPDNSLTLNVRLNTHWHAALPLFSRSLTLCSGGLQETSTPGRDSTTCVQWNNYSVMFE